MTRQKCRKAAGAVVAHFWLWLCRRSGFNQPFPLHPYLQTTHRTTLVNTHGVTQPPPHRRRRMIFGKNHRRTRNCQQVCLWVERWWVSECEGIECVGVLTPTHAHTAPARTPTPQVTTPPVCIPTPVYTCVWACLDVCGCECVHGCT